MQHIEDYKSLVTENRITEIEELVINIPGECRQYCPHCYWRKYAPRDTTIMHDKEFVSQLAERTKEIHTFLARSFRIDSLTISMPCSDRLVDYERVASSAEIHLRSMFKDAPVTLIGTMETLCGNSISPSPVLVDNIICTVHFRGLGENIDIHHIKRLNEYGHKQVEEGKAFTIQVMGWDIQTTPATYYDAYWNFVDKIRKTGHTVLVSMDISEQSAASHHSKYIRERMLSDAIKRNVRVHKCIVEYNLDAYMCYSPEYAYLEILYGQLYYGCPYLRTDCLNGNRGNI